MGVLGVDDVEIGCSLLLRPRFLLLFGLVFRRPPRKVNVRKIREATFFGGGTCTSSPRLDCKNTCCKAIGIRGTDAPADEDAVGGFGGVPTILTSMGSTETVSL